MYHPPLRWFTYDHLVEPLQGISKPFADLANYVVEVLPGGTQLDLALIYLLQAKDAAVRAKLEGET